MNLVWISLPAICKVFVSQHFTTSLYYSILAGMSEFISKLVLSPLAILTLSRSWRIVLAASENKNFDCTHSKSNLAWGGGSRINLCSYCWTSNRHYFTIFTETVKKKRCHTRKKVLPLLCHRFLSLIIIHWKIYNCNNLAISAAC